MRLSGPWREASKFSWSFCHGLLDWPSALKPSANGLNQFRDRGRDSTECVNYIPAGVSGLLKRSGPSAIIWLVIAIGILSVYLFSFWSRSHVEKEVFKLHPSSANLDAPSPINIKIFIPWIVTPLFHLHPDVMDRRFGESMGGVGGGLYSKCEAATGLLTPQETGSDCTNLTAYTFADNPAVFSGYWIGKFKDRKACKTIPDSDRKCSRHNSALLCLVRATGHKPAPSTIMQIPERMAT